MNTTKMQLGYSPLSKTINLAKMRMTKDGYLLRVANSEPQDVSNTAAQLVWQLEIDNGGEIIWEREDGKTMRLNTELIDTQMEQE